MTVLYSKQKKLSKISQDENLRELRPGNEIVREPRLLRGAPFNGGTRKSQLNFVEMLEISLLFCGKLYLVVCSAHLPCLGVVNVAVWYRLWQLHNPVVNLVSTPALDCNRQNQNERPKNMRAGVWDEHSDPELTFIVLGPPFLISRTPWSFLLSRIVQENNNNNELVWKARLTECLVDCNRALVTQCTAESGVRLSFGWSLSTLPAVTSSHKAALSHRSSPSDADAADSDNVRKAYKY